MGGCETCVKVFFILFNVLFLIIGIVLLGAGIFLAGYADTIWGFISPLFDSVLSSLGLSGMTLSFGNFDIPGLFRTLGIPFLVIGCLLFAVCLLGAVGACCKAKWVLIAYIVVVGVCLLGEIIFTMVIGIGWDTTYRPQIITYVKGLVTTDYYGPAGVTFFSLVWDFVMLSSACCGVTAYTDMQLATNWNRTYTYTSQGYSTTITMNVPITCCKMTGPFPSTTPTDVQGCLQTPNATNANLTPCIKPVDTLISTYSLYAILFVCFVCLMELLLMILAGFVFRPLHKKGKVSPSD